MNRIAFYETDILIIGGGLAGLCAAWAATRAPGRTVTVLSDGAGASPYVHGINIPLDEQDSAERFFSDTFTSGHSINDPGLVRALCYDSVDVPALLAAWGIALDKRDGKYVLLHPLGSSCPRVACSGSHTGAKILAKLHRDLRNKARLLSGYRAVKMEGTPGGKAIFAVGNEACWFLAKAVLLACGGFCNIFPFSTNSADSGGDGIAMAWDMGAALTDMEFVQFEPTAAVWPPELRGKGVITTMFFDGAVLENGLGQRFMLQYGPEAERVNKDVLAYGIYKELAMGRGTPHNGVYLNATAIPKGVMMDKYGMYYKRYESHGIDLLTQPIELAPAAHTSLGGVRINAHGATTVPGLFAAGEMVGGLHGANHIGGNAGLETLVFGLRAGASAAQWVDGQAQKVAIPLSQPDKIAALPETDGLSSRLFDAVASGLGIERNAMAMEAALHTVKGILAQTEPITSNKSLAREKLLAQFRLRNNAMTAWLALNAALRRKCSIGCHLRSDSVPEYAGYRIIMQKECGQLQMQMDPTGR